jgi:hypothetical protein
MSPPHHIVEADISTVLDYIHLHTDEGTGSSVHFLETDYPECGRFIVLRYPNYSCRFRI